MIAPPADMMAAALHYAGKGWPVFPCHPGTKRPLTPKGEGGTGGLKHATIDDATIRSWWHQFPKAMIGVPTGLPIGAFVVDIDAGVDDETGEVFEADEILARLEAKLAVKLPATWMAETPRGGRHLYFRLPTVGVGNRAGIVDRVDIRGSGGYVVVPPSARPDGRAYSWVISPW
jgi:putative DNA primase/helicase